MWQAMVSLLMPIWITNDDTIADGDTSLDIVVGTGPGDGTRVAIAAVDAIDVSRAIDVSHGVMGAHRVIGDCY